MMSPNTRDGVPVSGPASGCPTREARVPLNAGPASPILPRPLWVQFLPYKSTAPVLSETGQVNLSLAPPSPEEGSDAGVARCGTGTDAEKRSLSEKVAANTYLPAALAPSYDPYRARPRHHPSAPYQHLRQQTLRSSQWSFTAEVPPQRSVLQACSQLGLGRRWKLEEV